MPPEFFRLLSCLKGKMPYIHFPVMHTVRNKYVSFLSPPLRTQALQEIYECIHMIHYKKKVFIRN